MVSHGICPGKQTRGSKLIRTVFQLIWKNARHVLYYITFCYFYLIILTSFYGITKHITQAHQSGCYMKQDYTSNNGVLRLKVNSKYLKLDDINKEYQYLFLYLYRVYLIVLFFVPYSFRYSLG